MLGFSQRRGHPEAEGALTVGVECPAHPGLHADPFPASLPPTDPQHRALPSRVKGGGSLLPSNPHLWAWLPVGWADALKGQRD